MIIKCYSLVGVSTYAFSVTRAAELWLLMLRLGFRGSLKGFTGGVGGTVGESSSKTLLALVNTDGRELFKADLLSKVSSSSFKARSAGVLGG